MGATNGLAWWQRGAIYQIYPRSFNDSDGDGVGDLRGIVDRLDHLDSLGVEAIWLSPFFRSPMADFGYDISDYLDVDPVFGTLADVDALVAEAHRRGIKVVLDWVPNHTSDRHAWFGESRASRDAPRRDWYVWRDLGPGGEPPNNWRSAFDAVGDAWTPDERTGQAYLHSFTREQPDLNWDNPAVEAAMHDVLRFWLDRGVDGFRMDVIHKIAKDPELGDNEPGRRHDEDWPTIHGRLRRIRAVLDEYDDRMMVGEVYLYDLGRLVEYIKDGDQLHLAHNFTFLHLPWDAEAFRGAIADFVALSGDRAWPAWFLGNHDHPRIVTRYGAAQARVAAMLLYTLRGTPFVFQGEELGLPDAIIPPEAVVDMDGRDPERAPIPWAPPSQVGAGAGFTTGEPWLPLVADAERLNVQSQDGDPASMLTLVRELASEILQAGALVDLQARAGVLSYARELDGERLEIALNFRDAPASSPVGVLRPHEGIVGAMSSRDTPGSEHWSLSTLPGPANRG
jgi:alpha-glucosidase